ncbi:MAG: methyltransferase domain-containing protein [Pseudomonadota bacterium]
MNIDTFYTDHWRSIEDERIARYEQMFVWHDAQATLLAPAQLAPGQRVLDVGAGPGFFASGLAGLVGDQGRVDGVDINQRFVDDANTRFAALDNLQFHHIEDHRLPFADDTFDRVICKNVLEYVPDLMASLQEVQRVVKPGGRVQVIDSDWGFVVVQPWSKATVDEFFAAAGPAFNEPFIGRRIAGDLSALGFTDVTVTLSPFVDQSGRGLHVLRNMAGYIATFDTMPEARVSALLAEVEDALQANRFLFCLPQFLVVGVK